MDLLCTDSQTQSLLPTTDTQTGDLDCLSVLHNPTENMLSAHEQTATQTMSDLSEATDKSTVPLSYISSCLSQEQSTDSKSLKHPSSGSNTSECFPLCSEPAPTDGDFRDSDHSGSSEPILPPLFAKDSHLSRDFLPPKTDAGPEPAFPLIRHSSSPQPFADLLSKSETLTEPFSEPLSTSGLLRSLSHQSDSLESDTASAPLSDLYIFESEMHDFILSPNVDPQEIKCPEYTVLSQSKENEADNDCDRHVQICDSLAVVTKYYRSSSEDQLLVDYESDVSQRMGLRPPAADASEGGLMSVNDVRQEKGEVTGLTPRAQRSDSPTELWLDACQYLAGEDTEDRDVLDKMGHSVIQEGLPTTTAHASFPSGETQGSGYSPEGSDVIGWASDDTRSWGPPVERWSSVDSWATALSDWAEIISAPPEDITAAFTEIGAEIDALTQALAEVTTHIETELPVEGQDQVQTQLPMGVQDQPLEAQKIVESSVFSGQSCLSFCRGAELQDRQGSRSVESLCDHTTQRRKEAEEIQRSQQTSMGSSGVEVASSGRYGTEVTVIPGCTLSVDLDETATNFFHFGYDESVEIRNDVVLNIIEDTDLEEKNAPAELVIKEPSRDEVCEVKDEHILSPLGLVAEQKGGNNHGPTEIPEVDRQGAKPSPDLYFHSAHPLTNSHVPSADTQTRLHVKAETHVSPNTLPDLDGARQVEPQWGSPKFIMPLAPLSIGFSLVRQASSSLTSKDQECAKSSPNDNGDLSCDLWPTSDEITDCLSVEADEDLIHKKESTVDSAEKSLHNLKTDETAQCFHTDRKIIEGITDLSGVFSNFVPINHFIVSEENRVAYVTLDLYDPVGSKAAKPSVTAVQSEISELRTAEKMPHKTHKTTSECKTRSKKDRSAGHHHQGAQHHVSAQQTCKAQDNLPGENHTRQDTAAGLEDKEVKLVIETGVGPEKGSSKPHGKKKKKHTQNTTGGKSIAGEPLGEVENGAKPQSAKGRIDAFEAKLGAKAGKVIKDSDQSDSLEKKSQKSEAKEEKPVPHAEHKDKPPKNVTSPLKDDVIKRRRLSQDKFGKIVSALESKLPKEDVSIQAKGEEPKADAGATRRKAYSEVVKQKTIIPKEDPKVVQPIQAVSVSGDPQSLCLWCQFAAVFTDYTVTWSREGTVLAEIKRSAGDESRVSLTISNASNKDLGKYQCRLSSLHGSVTLDYLLTYEVLSEIVIPSSPKTISSAPVEVAREEEDVNCSRLMFKEDFLSEQFFGENHSASIITEKVHFGEGMHRRAFRTKLQAGQINLLLPGHSCVLKVHNAISYGTKNNDELVQKNFNLAVEECQVQNTAREYIKSYTAAAQSFEAFGEIPEIIPIYLVHRPSNDIPYATLEEELIGDFVKYSVKDGKEINLMRRDSEAGQKCCAFQHWVYHKTEGNLLVTDMQGVGMKLTDVGIATCKKGYKGFKGNCATSFIDQFKALHQCNVYCEILGLKSLQPKPKKPASAPKPKPQPSAAPKKKPFGPTVKGKS